MNNSKNLKLLIHDTKVASVARVRLKVHFQPVTQGRAIVILDAYFKRSYDPNEVIGMYGARLKEILENMEDTEIESPDTPNTFSGILQAIYR